MQCSQRLVAAFHRVGAHAKAAHHGAENVACAGIVIHDQHPVGSANAVELGADIGRGGGLHLHREYKDAAHADLALHIELAAHELHQPVTDGQAQTGAAIAARGLAIGLRERAEKLGNLPRIHAYASVAHTDAKNMGLRRASGQQRRALQFDGDNDFPMVGELDGIAHQVVEHLAQPQWVAPQMARHFRCNRIDDFNAFFLGTQGGDGRDRFQNIVQRELHGLQRQHACFDLGIVQDVVDDGQQRVGRQLHFLQIVALLGRQRRLLHQPGHADDGIHRCADFVAHGGQKVGLGAFRAFCRFLGLLECQFGFALAGDVQQDAIPDHAAFHASGG